MILFLKKKGDGFNINIKNSERTDLVINNLNNMDTIDTKKITLLPWHDKDNPIIMFNANDRINGDKNSKKYENNKKKMVEFVKYFNKNSRWKNNETNFVSEHCNLNIWDSHYEYKILKKYAKKYSYYDAMSVYNFITKALTSPCCQTKTKIIRSVVNIPVIIPTVREKPVYIPVNIPKKIHPKEKKCEKCADTDVQKSTQLPTLPPTSPCHMYKDIIKNVTTGIKTTSKLLKL
jgi:hypothetical protein